MTVLVGVRCRDGVVIGSDSSTTFAAGNASTIEQSARKIEIIGGKLITAGTGAMGLAQRFCAQLQSMHDLGTKEGGYMGRPAVEVGKQMSAAAIKDFSFTSASKGQFGALVAFRTGKELHLCEFATTDLQPELKTEHLWYVAMGSGQLIADPFLALMRKVFWKDGMPSLPEATFAVAWTLQHTIEINPGGVNGPVRIATLSWDKGQVGGDHVARYLSSDEIGEHLQSVAAAETHLAKFRELLAGAVDAPAIPSAPLA